MRERAATSRALAILACICGCVPAVTAQSDTLIHVYQLGDVVVHAHEPGNRYEGFIQQVMQDTSFHHAFLNTRFYPHRLTGDLRVRDRKEKRRARWLRWAHLERRGAIAELITDSVLEEGNLRKADDEARSFTVRMFADVFYPEGPFVAHHAVGQKEIGLVRGSRMEKYRSELKKFMFNPGQEIASVPFIGDKLALYSPEMAPLYEHSIATEMRDGRPCLLFSSIARDTVDGKPADPDDTVIARMTTWFDQETFHVVERSYRLRRASMLVDFDITIHVRNAVIGTEVVPSRVEYDGRWDIPFERAEDVRFLLTYSDWVVPK